LEKANFPFKHFFTLDKLIKFWEKKAIEASDGCERDFASSLVNKVKNIPEINGPISDYSLLNKHSLIIDGLVSAIFPSAYLNSNLQAIAPINSFKAVYCTERFRSLFCKEDGDFEFDLNVDFELFNNGKIIANYAVILQTFYNSRMQVVFPLFRKIVDPDTGLERYFKMNLDNRFTELKLVGELPPLTNEQVTFLAENVMKPELMLEIIPPDRFELSGFLVINMFEVTEQETLSSIKQDLLKKDIFAYQAGFKDIERKIQTMFRNPRLSLGLVAISNEKTRMLNAGHMVGNSFLLNESCINHCKDYSNSIYEKAIETREPQIIYDLENMGKCSPVDKAIAVQGIRNILVAGLEVDGKYIGMLELASPVPGDINAINAVKLHNILPLFGLAMNRSLEDLENKVQSIIKEKCTSIHPSVEWRFRKAAIKLIEKEKNDEYADMEEIIFKDVYPIYALSDIRNSSLIRNAAIQSDLKHNLLLAREVVNCALKRRYLPVLELLNYRIEERILSIDTGLHSGDEAGIISFLKREVESLFPIVKDFGKNVSDAISNYTNSLDPGLGFYYNKRKAYEESVLLLNEEIASLVDEEEELAQVMLPHYFEKYKTDGVEFTIYMGDSLLEQGGFDELYLKNIRLWQLMLMCKIARKAEYTKEKLNVKLDLAHLILVQNQPLSIRFHHDQKRFDVDGTYNVHYEILKKRIDKAELKGKEERLTQPGKLAIVYSQPSEANEYRQYIAFLQSKGYLEDKIEDLELKDLQGVFGLRALRAGINLSTKKIPEEFDISSSINLIEKVTKVI